MSSGKKLETQLPSNEKTSTKKRTDYSKTLQNRRVTGELYILIAMDKCCQRPVTVILELTDSNEIVNVRGGCTYLHGVPEKNKIWKV